MACLVFLVVNPSARKVSSCGIVIRPTGTNDPGGSDPGYCLGSTLTQQVIDISGLRGGVKRQAMPKLDVICPNCGSTHTQLTSQFGSTPCKALYKCIDCREPFDYFRCH